MLGDICAAPSRTAGKPDGSNRPMQIMIDITASRVVGDDTVETDVKIIFVTYATVCSYKLKD